MAGSPPAQPLLWAPAPWEASLWAQSRPLLQPLGHQPRENGKRARLVPSPMSVRGEGRAGAQPRLNAGWRRSPRGPGVSEELAEVAHFVQQVLR